MQVRAPDDMCFQHGKDVKPQSEISDIMGFDSSMLKLVLESFVDEVVEESVEMIPERPLFVHAVVVVANEGEEFCQASCVRQLDGIQVQHSVQAATPDFEDDFLARIARQINESREMLGNIHYSESVPSSPQKSSMQPMHCSHTNELLRPFEQTNTFLTRPTRQTTSVQFPSMNRSRGQV